MKPFTLALGNGIALALSGKLQFKTKDAGVIPGSGVGTGLGITGLDDSKMSSTMFAAGQKAWSPLQNNGPGVEWKIFCDKVSLAVATHLKTNAILQSTHSPVFAGAGKVTAYSGVTGDDIKASIVAQSPAPWQKARMPELAEAVGKGVAEELTGHAPADSVVIAGSPAGTPSGGSGSGSGIVL